MTTEEKKSLLEKLEAAIYSGHLKVKNGDKEINYRSMSEMLQARNLLRADLGITAKSSKRIVMTVSKGLEE